MIQSLRAVAALMVVLLHCTEMWALRVQTGSSDAIWQHGAAGVDIFFVISGFIMTVSSRHLVGEPLGWLQFIKNRIVRIVPLYWLLTTLKLVAVVAAGGAGAAQRIESGLRDGVLRLPAFGRQRGPFPSAFTGGLDADV
jgi:peptidoglycan/LPS O-acetylase OafA/YrhL